MIYGLKVLKEDIKYNIDKQYKDISYLCKTYLRIDIQTDLYQIQICSDLFDLDAYTIFLKITSDSLVVSNKTSFVTAGYVVKDLTDKTIHKFRYDTFSTDKSDIILERIDKTSCPYNSLVKKFYQQVNLTNTFHTGI